MTALRYVLILALVFLPASPFATTFPVTKTADTNDGNCDPDCSLREAIDAANTNPGADDVSVPAGTYLLALGQLVVSDAVSVAGAGQTNTIIDGNALDRVFDIEATSGVVEISGVTIQNGNIYPAHGGGIRAHSLTLTNSTVSGNTANQSGAGIYIDQYDYIAITNTIVADNGTTTPNCNNVGSGSLGNNLTDDTSCGFTAPGDLVVADAMLGPLQDNGGLTETHMPLPGSPAIDAANNASCSPLDQRGVNRPIDGNGDATATCDIGAVEFDPVLDSFVVEPAATLNSDAGIDSLEDAKPDVATDGAGNWVAVWDVAAAFGTGEDILVARSIDAGQTWTSPAVIADSGALHDAARLATGGSGTWIAVWHSNDDLGGTLGTDWDIFYSRSTDAGLNWTTPAALHADFGADGNARDIFPTVATDGGGTWVVAWETCAVSSCNINDDKDILFSRSGNDGTTWSRPNFLNSDASGDAPKSDSRPSLATDGLGTWVAMWNPLMARSTNDGRNWSTVTAAVVSGSPHVVTDGLGTWLAAGTTVVGSDDDIEVSRSTDAGISWTPAVALNTNAVTDSGNDSSPQLATDGAGNWLATWISAEDLGGTLGTDLDVLWARSMDAGTSWTAPKALDANASGDVGIDLGPRLATDALGNWVMVWYSNDDRGGTIGTDFDVLFSTGIGPDRDGDGLTDGAEVNVHGTDPLLADTDGDGLSDGDEVNVHLTDPLDPDHDGDGVCDGAGTGGGTCSAGPDNCPFVPNNSQANSDPLPAGDACQCGDVNGDFIVDGLDVQIAREKLMGAPLSGSFDVARCDFTGAAGAVCGVDDIFLLDRLVSGAPITLENDCPAYLGP